VCAGNADTAYDDENLCCVSSWPKSFSYALFTLPSSCNGRKLF
jgi:hypothetical protein